MSSRDSCLFVSPFDNAVLKQSGTPPSAQQRFTSSILTNIIQGYPPIGLEIDRLNVA